MSWKRQQLNLSEMNIKMLNSLKIQQSKLHCVLLLSVGRTEKQLYEGVAHRKALMSNKHIKDRVRGHDGFGDDVFWTEWMVIHDH